MRLWRAYYRPKQVDEALTILAKYKGDARVVAGGTDLLLEMQQGHKPPVTALVDVTGVEEMRGIVAENGRILVGAAVTHTEIVASELLVQKATCLVESCGVIGGPQVRNVATLGGNVAHALPAADGTTALVVLDAEVEVAGENGRSWHPILSLFRGPGKSAVDHTRELITRFRFVAATGREGSAFKRIMRPQGVALPILACAVWVKLAEGETAVIEDVRICIGPVKPVPCRAEQAEAVLRGRTLAEALADCVMAAQNEFSPRTSKHRATAEYRREMIGVLLRRSLPLAVSRAQTGQIVPEGVGLA
ncbi:MAG: xanthine dehydrogenase family protein subunit M [Chloroflexi bacterium]|nr:MAG: xanthine dehydrogenase family protein subunit M [Chloroflexota bacterium]